jgi:type VI protein secretion system component VasK
MNKEYFIKASGMIAAFTQEQIEPYVEESNKVRRQHLKNGNREAFRAEVVKQQEYSVLVGLKQFELFFKEVGVSQQCFNSTK